MPSNPDICDCGSQLFVAVWSVAHKDNDVPDDELDPKQGNTIKKPVGFMCLECSSLQLTREIPRRHAEDDSKDMPQLADRDMVREDERNGTEESTVNGVSDFVGTTSENSEPESKASGDDQEGDSGGVTNKLKDMFARFK